MKNRYYADPLTGEKRVLYVHPIDRKAEKDYSTLTEPERVWYTTTKFIICVRDGGLISYYYNGYARYVADLLSSLDILGAVDAKALVLKINALFDVEVPDTSEALNDAIISWPEMPEYRITEENAEAELAAAKDAEARLNDYALRHGIER